MTAVFSCPRRKGGTFLNQPRFVQAWFLPVWIILGVGKALIFTITFRRLAPRLGRQSGIAPWVPLLAPAQEHRARLIGQVVRMTARYTPWDSNWPLLRFLWVTGVFRTPLAPIYTCQDP